MRRIIIPIRRLTTEHPLVFLSKHSRPSTHSPPENEPDRVAIYAREATRIISENDPLIARLLPEEIRARLVELQRVLKINEWPHSI